MLKYKSIQYTWCSRPWAFFSMHEWSWMILNDAKPVQTLQVGDRGWKVRALIFLPAMGDLVGSILSFTGLVYISNSTAQMLGSSIIIMVALNSYIFLGRRYNRIQYLGMGIVLASLLVVGYSADMAARDKTVSTGMQEYSASQQAFGMFLCVLARVVNSIQFVLEEKVMGESGFHPFEVTGTEGVYGLIMTACVIMPTLAVIPGSDVGGVFENTKDSLLMIQRNSTLDLVLIFYLLGLWGLNALGMMVMKHLGSVFRAVSRNMQALFVWLIDMALFYGLGQRGFGYGPVGEPWQGQASWIQVIGFIFMTVGVLCLCLWKCRATSYGGSSRGTKRNSFSHPGGLFHARARIGSGSRCDAFSLGRHRRRVQSGRWCLWRCRSLSESPLQLNRLDDTKDLCRRTYQASWQQCRDGHGRLVKLWTPSGLFSCGIMFASANAFRRIHTYVYITN